MARHGENIHKRKDGRWEGRYIKGRSETGKAIWGYVYAYSYVDAKSALIRKKVKTADYTVPLGAQELTFSALSELWLSTLNDLEESSIAHYRYSIEHYILPVIGDLRISQLSGAKLELCVLQIISPVGGEHKPFGASLSRECISLVRRLCKYAYKLHLMPMIELSIKPVKETKEFPEALSLEEQAAVNRFVFKNPTPRKAGILFMLQLGLRISEVCGLQWGDIDLVHATFEWLSKYIGKMTERTKSQSIGRGSRGSSSDSYQLTARDLCSPDEIRRMDDGDCLVLLRSEPPVIDHKFDLMRHPNVKLTPDGGAAPYRMPDDYAQTAQTISPDVVTGLTEPAITEVMYDEIQKIMEEIHNEQERNL